MLKVIFNNPNCLQESTCAANLVFDCVKFSEFRAMSVHFHERGYHDSYHKHCEAVCDYPIEYVFHGLHYIVVKGCLQSIFESPYGQVNQSNTSTNYEAFNGHRGLRKMKKDNKEIKYYINYE